MPKETFINTREQDKPTNTTADLAALVCPACNLSARFVPLYRFNTGGVHAQIVLGGKPMMQCGGCRAVLVWTPPAVAGEHDGGWDRSSLIVDREELP